MSAPVIVEVPVFSSLCNEAFRLRRDIFVREQKIPEDEEFEAADLTARHFVAILGGEVCGTMRIIVTDEHVRIGRVAVGQPWRGRGVAAAIIEHALSVFADVASGRFYLTAQADKLRFYEKFGFTAYGESFLDGGIPHLKMKTY
ncbi:GNAT family N-acetyltransferase [Rhizobium alvei]|uniref:GNAT family N-acetyltransferase n=1 Tax=Rhizobium alvei TaxID=1132659 RepID=A0ABT8YN79_9HYPH|nr:GNAT family N-acetyltransferase [Rhizobium alvei]MDO6965149.1 GNAT family N-acetyltransferase [Rhizobium alvei]